MPNWVTNKLYLKHAEDARFVLRTADDAPNDQGMTVDFNILLPMPADLDITCGYNPAIPEEDINIPIGRLSQKKYVDKCVAAGFNAWNAEREYNQQKYGATTWYDWCVSNWGTKWNACDVEKADAGDVIIFNTAWGMPEGWVNELAKHADFTILYADEATGSNCGWCTFMGGECVASWDTDYARRESSSEHADKAVAMSLYVRGWLYDYTDEDARDNFIMSYGLDDLDWLKESVYARRLVRVYDKLPELLLQILPQWLIDEEDIESYARKL